MFVLDKSIFVAGCAVLAFIVMSIIIGLIYFGWIRNTTPCVNEGNCFVNCYRYALVDKFSNSIRTNIGVFFYNNMANDFKKNEYINFYKTILNKQKDLKITDI